MLALDLTKTPLKDVVARYNTLADKLGTRPVKKFENRSVALRRLEDIEAEAVAYKRQLAAEARAAEKARLEAEARAAEEARRLEAEARPFTVERKKRQKVFHYPPKEVISRLQPGSLRAEARDLLLNGATLGRVEELIADWDRRRNVEPFRLEPRAYGLVRLLHTYVGYALREEGVGDDNKVIYVMDKEAWAAWKAQSK
jgi:hypothetical protein